MALNKKLLLKTADALESGKFRQVRRSWGSGTAKSTAKSSFDAGFCCLHVLAAVASNTEDKEMNFEQRVYGLGFAGQGRSITVEKISGMSLRQIKRFIDMNDNEGKTFSEIAVAMRQLANKE